MEGATWLRLYKRGTRTTWYKPLLSRRYVSMYRGETTFGLMSSTDMRLGMVLSNMTGWCKEQIRGSSGGEATCGLTIRPIVDGASTLGRLGTDY